MQLLIVGLALFLGMHSISIFALSLRDAMVARSELGYKIVYGLVSLAGLVLISEGYADARLSPTTLYVTPLWMQHVTAVLMLPVFVLFFAPYLQGRISRAAKHPQLLAIKLWAFSHLLANGSLADVLLFGSFLLWAVADRISLKRRPARDVPGLPASFTNDVLAIVLGLALYGATVLWLHQSVLGVRPLPGVS